jgi:hypothetical protein
VLFNRKRQGKHRDDEGGLFVLLTLSSPGAWCEGWQTPHAYVG